MQTINKQFLQDSEILSERFEYNIKNFICATEGIVNSKNKNSLGNEAIRSFFPQYAPHVI